MTQYVHYTFGNNSSGITNFATAGRFDGHARRNQYALNAYGHPIWGPMDQGSDVISVDGGLSNPYQHTWQIGLRIDRWWPVAGVVDGLLCGNDGKLFAYANDQYYAYLHQEGTYPPLVESGIYHFSVEIASGEGEVQFWLGVGGNRPFQVPINGEGDEGGRHWWDFNYSLQLHTDYYFQIVFNLSSTVTGGDYYIGNCAPGCADPMVTGFPCGCYFYVWREDNTALDLSKGGNWSTDVALWTTKGGGGGGTNPPVVCPCPHIWFGIESPGNNLGACEQNVGQAVHFAGISGMVNDKGQWIAGKYDTSIVTCYEHDTESGVTRQLLRSQPDKNGNIKFAFTRPTVTKSTYWIKSDAHGENSGTVTVNWLKPGAAKGSQKVVPESGFGGSSPTACSPASGSVACFVRGTDGGIYYKVYSGSAWSSSWTDIGGITGGGTGPGVCSPGGGRYDVFTGGGGGVTYHKFNTGAKWSAWENLGGVAASSCGAACPASGQWVYAVRGTNGACYQKSYYSGAWHGWMNLGGNLKEGTGPTICSWGGGRADVFVIGTDSHVYHKSLSGGIWQTSWENLGGVATSSPAAAALGSGSLAIFVRGNDGGLWMRAFSGGSWQSWVELGGLMATGTGPGAAAEGSNYHVFVAGTDGQIYHSSGAGATWAQWENLGGKVSISPTEPGTMPGGLIPKPKEADKKEDTDTSTDTTQPTTTPEQPTDISLEPVEPVAAAVTEGVTILLRDHKKKA